MYKLIFFVFALMLASSTSFARSQHCNTDGIHVEYCKKGDAITVEESQVNNYCDFSKTIVWTGYHYKVKTLRMFSCIYIGYDRKLREK